MRAAIVLLVAVAMCLASAADALAAHDIQGVSESLVKQMRFSLRDGPRVGDTVHVLLFTDQRGNASNLGEQLARALTDRIAQGDYVFEVLGPRPTGSERNNQRRTGSSGAAAARPAYIIAGDYVCDRADNCMVRVYLKRRDEKLDAYVDRVSACVRFSGSGDSVECAVESRRANKAPDAKADREQRATSSGKSGSERSVASKLPPEVSSPVTAKSIPAAVTNGADPNQSQSSWSKGRRALFFLTGGVGIAGLLVGAGLTTAAEEASSDDAKGLREGSYAAFGIGAAALTASLIILLTRKSSTSARSAGYISTPTRISLMSRMDGAEIVFHGVM